MTPDDARPRPLDLLILGGTKFLGPHLVDAARARGHRVTLFHRGKTNPGLFPELEHLKGDRDGDLGALAGRRWHAVIDTSGYVPRQVDASARLLAGAVERYLFVSTISVYAQPLAPGAREDAPLAAPSTPGSEDVGKDYGALKALCEQAAERAMPGRVLAVRPGLIAGPGDPTDRFTYWPVRLARGGEVLAPGAGQDPWQLVDGRDLAAWLVRCAEARTVGTMNAVGPGRPGTFADFLARVAAGAQVTAPRLTWVDEAFLEQQGIGAWMDLPVWTGSDSGFARVDASRALAAGLTCRDVAETSRDTLAWRSRDPAPLRAGLTAERETGALTAWHARA
jgi:2'-hydroxyisoflavone reductase